VELVGRGGFHEETAPYGVDLLVLKACEVAEAHSFVQGSCILSGKVLHSRRPSGVELYGLRYRDRANHDDEVPYVPYARSSALAHGLIGDGSMALAPPSIQHRLLHNRDAVYPLQWLDI
jgi:hypothetical protein